jgi:hypothetical protein
MRGAVSKESGAFFLKDLLYSSSNFVDYVACYHSIQRHIIEANPKCTFDVFCQSWNPELEKEITNLYRPVKSCFEDNRLYNDEISKKCKDDRHFGGISQALSIQKSLQLKEGFQDYDLVILYRYDVLLWKDIRLETYTDLNAIYVNAHQGGNGDFHFIMGDETSKDFMYLYDSLDYGNTYEMHQWIQRYIVHFLKRKVIMDDIYPGIHQECIRKIHDFSIRPGHLTQEQLDSYRSNP